IPLIARHGLFAGARRAACVPDTPAGHAYVQRVVAEQGRRGWPMAVLAFEVGEDEVAPTDDPYGIGLALARPAAGLPPRLLDKVQAIEPQGRRVASAFREWESGHGLCWLAPERLDRGATLEVNTALRDQGLLPPGGLEAAQRGLAERRGLRALPAAAAGFSAVLGAAAAFFLFAGRGGAPPASPTEAIYRKHCAGCHGQTGRGDGLEARLTFLKVPDMTDPARMASLTDEYLYTVTAKGSAALGGTAGMPGWDQILKQDQIRALVAYIRTFSRTSRPSR
ncbi:MAG TPA: cytochrome c, partial [Candidatus Methylomirabilis sp.]